MSRVLDVEDLASVEWSKLDGAYGPSVGDHDVAAALEILATDHDEESDARNDALDCVLWSHGWHQGSIYDVSAAIVPFLVAWTTRGHDVGGELRVGLQSLAASANAASEHAHAAAVHAAFVACADTLLGWPDADAQTVAVVCATTPVLRERWLERRAAAAQLTTLDYLAIAAGTPPAWAITRARDAVTDFGAAALLAVHAGPPAELALDVERALSPAARIDWSDLLDDLGLEVPVVRAPFAGELIDGHVVFVSPAFVLVRVGTRNVRIQLRVDVDKGEAVRVGLSPHGEPRVLEVRGTRHDLAYETVRGAVSNPTM